MQAGTDRCFLSPTILPTFRTGRKDCEPNEELEQAWQMMFMMMMVMMMVMMVMMMITLPELMMIVTLTWLLFHTRARSRSH